MSPPGIDGFGCFWWSEFLTAGSSLPNESQWEMIEQGPNYGNNEEQHFIADISTAIVSQGELVIRPQFDGNRWTSARLHCRENFHADDGRIMVIQAELKLGILGKEYWSGIWPSFWTLGKSYRGVGDSAWPACGEIDIFENASGENFTIPAAHTTGPMIGETGYHVEFNRDEWNTWAIRIDRKSSNGDWREETIEWLLNGRVIYTWKGDWVESFEQWECLAHQPHFPILQVAVGTNWNGGSKPNDKTATDAGVGLRVRYVAVFFDGSW